MLDEWIRSGLDLILIIMVGIGLVQATRLIWHLAGLRASRVEMEHFVRDFNATVLRAEAGIKGLKTAARESGDDLEKLVEKSVIVRDELQFIVESADKLADRLAKTASNLIRPEPKQAEKSYESKVAPQSQPKPVAAALAKTPDRSPERIQERTIAPDPVNETETQPTSRAERELMQALKKLS